MIEAPNLGHYRHYHGIRGVRVYCRNGRACWHSAKLNVDDLPDDVVLRSLGPRMVCTQCGLVGADVRPDWSECVPGVALRATTEAVEEPRGPRRVR